MQITRVYLRWYKSFNIDYTGTAGGDRVPNKRPWNAWKLNSALADLPFVEIPIEREITTIIGGNESGKSHLLSAISNVLSGSSIPVDPFSTSAAQGKTFSQTDLCHFALPLDKHASLWPQLGVELSGLTREEFKAIVGSEPVPGNGELVIRLFLMPESEIAAKVYHSGSEEPRVLSYADLEAIRKNLPAVHFINSQLPLADEVYLEDLILGYGDSVKNEEPFFDTRTVLNIARSLFKLAVPAPTAQMPKEVSETLHGWQNELTQSSKRRAQELQLEVKLFRDVLGIPKEALKRLYELKDEDKGHAAALVSKWSEELERVLNLSRYWQQDQAFSIELKYHKRVISFEISDKTKKIYTFKERSSGLRYFLSYYIQAKALEQLSKSSPAIILMDEPDSFLSIAGQRNLLAVFESLVRSGKRRRFQLVYTTHSPFLIHRNFPKRVRLVRKGDAEEGTQLVDKSRERRFEPIRSALGIELSQTLFMGAINIVTEGPTDQYFIAEAIRIFAPEVAASDLINLNEVVIVSAESASGVYKLVSSSQWADEVVPTAIILLDQDDAGRTERERLIGKARGIKKILEDDSIIFVDTFLEPNPLRGAAETLSLTTEDLIPSSLFIAAIKSYLNRWLPEKASSAVGIDAMLTEQSFQALGHVAAARAIFDNVRGTSGAEYDKLGVFEEVFDILWAGKNVDSTDRDILKNRVIKLCHALKSKIELSTKAERQQTGVQAIKRLIGDFFLQHQQTLPATLDLELKLIRLSAEANTFGSKDGSSLMAVLSGLIAEAKSIRQSGRSELSRDDWITWKARLDAIAHNPLLPRLELDSAAKSATEVLLESEKPNALIDKPAQGTVALPASGAAEATPKVDTQKPTSLG